ncbi:MAG: thiamine phosphate synthase [Trichodesmium sp. St16_bin4-tuft]|nr:thiamine phosphate synthase [Trichodesmium sp. St4_bin8_1]MDE5071876.1 thiamine phosphate synthase [Trichodesmium sp. St5_bin8]MDE5078759.1 thiamine phosphate synthase [Trichodesmium sp. St2_bin6]MDE5090521.1 thiamine phosphate synthase [Trichodesmium sp. St18_bin3_1_1]MDE5100982.1 thiamine phosphate synthase [Trichodesmium sp. St16_bin4-tuft]MDE5103418.1 thiamine phosphate synthase [Trichodesmium sp. St19_bin2]
MGDQYNLEQNVQPAIRRILDANLDRAREGLRIIEEWCRFGLNSIDLAHECKKLRQEIGGWHATELRMSRNTPNDPGTQLTHPQEEHRSDIEQLLQVNFCRLEEALRVLEEYGKIYNSQMALACKQIRYRVYTIESGILAYKRNQQLQDSYLYLVTSPEEKLVDIVEAALQGGLTLVQYRNKTADDVTRLTEAKKLCEVCRRYGALFIVNDRVDLAIAVDADGVHLGQNDIPLNLARQLLGPQKLVGRSTTNQEEMERAIQEEADYIGVGPIYETPTKVGKKAVGLEYISYVVKNCSIPWFAIGGIDMQNCDEVLSAGALRVSVVRAIMQSEQPTLVTQYFLSQLSRYQTLRSHSILPEKV